MKDQIDFGAPPTVERSIEALQPATPGSLQAMADQGVLRQLNLDSQASVSKTSASVMIEGFSIDVNQPQLIADARCTKGWATVYGPTGNRTADGSRYTGSEQGVAVDLKQPVLGADLGSKLVITNLNNNETTTQRVRDYGGFGNPSKYRTPDGQPRLVDLTYGAASRIGAGDMTPVRVCMPEG